jgi:hypothetical protein
MKWIMHVGTLVAMLVGAASLLLMVFYGGAWMGRTETTLETIRAAVTEQKQDGVAKETHLHAIDSRFVEDSVLHERQDGRLSTLERFHYGSGG